MSEVCGATLIYEFGRLASTVYDLKFTRTGVKRWIVKYTYHRYFCWKCKTAFQRQRAREKYGIDLRAFVLYFIIELRLSQAAVAHCLSQLFGLDLSRGTINRIKGAGARYYQDLLCGPTVLLLISDGQFASGRPPGSTMALDPAA
jgi:hypothetical protein